MTRDAGGLVRSAVMAARRCWAAGAAYRPTDSPEADRRRTSTRRCSTRTTTSTTPRVGRTIDRDVYLLEERRRRAPRGSTTRGPRPAAPTSGSATLFGGARPRPSRPTGITNAHPRRHRAARRHHRSRGDQRVSRPLRARSSTSRASAGQAFAQIVWTGRARRRRLRLVRFLSTASPPRCSTARATSRTRCARRRLPRRLRPRKPTPGSTYSKNTWATP